MSWWEILWKLLPFTHSENGSVNWALMSLDMGDWVITIITLILWFGFGFFFYKLRSSYKVDKNKIDYFKTALEKFDPQTQRNELEEYLQAYDSANQDSNLYKIWREFQESLIEINRHNNTVYYNSLDAEYFFNKQILLTHIGTKWYSTVPSLLLGIGLIGTFLGLFVGLVQLNLADQSALTASMQALIHAAGVKFASSIWGLGLSLFFTYKEKRWEESLETQIEFIQNSINFLYKRKTAEQSLEEIRESNEDVRDEIKNIAPSLSKMLSEDFSFALREISQNIQNDMTFHSDKTITEIKNIAPSISESLGANLATAIGNSIKEAIAPAMKELSDTIKQSLEDSQKGGESTLKDILEAFIIKLNSSLGEMPKNLEAVLIQTRDTLENFKNSQTEINDKLSGLPNIVTKLLKDIEDSGNKERESSHKSREEFSESIKTLNIDLNTLSGTLKNNMELMNEAIHKSSEKLANIPEHLKAFNEDITKFDRVFSENINNFKSSSDNLATFSTNITNVSEKLKEYSTTLSNSVGQISSIVSQLSSLKDSSVRTYEQLANQYKNLLDTNAESATQYEKSVKRYLTEYHTSINGAIHSTFSAFDTQLKDFAESMTDAIRDLEEMLEKIDDKLK